MADTGTGIPYWLPYLHFGYLPAERPELPFKLPEAPVHLPNHLGAAAKVAGEVLAKVIHDSLVPGKTHLIPLSGGLDSRALLAAALEVGADVHAVTFGTPGTMDYEYGAAVAGRAKVRHSRVDLTELPPDTTALVESVRAGGRWTYTFDAYYNRLVSARYGPECVILSGFLGDPVAGSHCHPEIATQKEVLQVFTMQERFARRQSLLPAGYDPVVALPENFEPFLVKGGSLYESLDFAIRQARAIRPIVVDERFDVRTPFVDPRWLSVMFSAPTEWRQGCVLYEAALMRRWPRLYRLPTKNHQGLGLHPAWQKGFWLYLRQRQLQQGAGLIPSAYSLMNYVDFKHWFAVPGAIYNVARENLADLKARRALPWLDPEKILEQHRQGMVDLSRELQLLIGLEINLKAAT